jgi:hypothetical protein
VSHFRSPAGEFFRFLPENVAFGYSPRRPLAAERQGFEAAMTVRAGRSIVPTGYDGYLAGHVVELMGKFTQSSFLSS